jgi:hypothetical protein
MPEFSLLSTAQVDMLVAHLRRFCRDDGWPPGNLNFRRALFTIKAFPENEVALAPTVSHSQSTYTRVRVEATYGVRVGRRAQLEFGVPGETVQWVTGRVVGVGDVSAGGKYVLYVDPRRPLILTAGLDVSLRTGSLQWGFGEGTTVTEPSLAASFRWRALSVQSDVRTQFYARKIPNEYYRHVWYNAAIARERSGVSTAWTVGVEVNGVDTAVGLTPYVLKGLTRTGSLAAGFGVRIPLTNPFPYTSDLVRWRGYLLWDYTRPLRGRQ